MSLIIGVLAFLFGFAMVWYIWWLAIVSFLGLVLTVIGRSLDDHTHYAIPAVEVERIEEERYQRMSVAVNQSEKDHAAPEPLAQE